MKLKMILCLATMLFLLAACGPRDIKAGEDMNSDSITLEKGQQLVVSLKGNPTTGYNWELSEFDPAVIKQVGEAEYKSDSMLIGSGGVLTFTFEALQTGKTNLKLIYHRSFETDVPPAEVYELFVEVN